MGGGRLKQLQQATGVRARVDWRDGSVLLSGPPDAIEDATQRLDGLFISLLEKGRRPPCWLSS